HTRSYGDWSSDVCSSDLKQSTIWSPYYRITLFEVPPPEGWPRPPAYLIDVNHDYHQKILDLSADFMGHNFPSAELNREGLPAYRSEERRVGKEWRSQVLQ